MKVAPVSADLLIKLAMLGVGVYALVWVGKKVTAMGSGALDSAATGLNPTSDKNWAYQAAGYGLAPDQTVGTWTYDQVQRFRSWLGLSVSPYDVPASNQTFVIPPDFGVTSAEVNNGW